ncbi:MAG: hypothetical protein WC889_12395 [Myxococcota bacterium]|jgi:hypothetical protein
MKLSRIAASVFVPVALASAAAVFSCSETAGGGGDGGAKSCEEYGKSCVMALKNGCFDPSGSCVNSGLKNVTWANGAKITMATSTTNINVQMYGSKGSQCYQMDVPVTTADPYDVTIKTSDLKMYILRYSKSDSSVTVACPNGTQEKYSQADFTVITQCFGGDWQAMIKDCKIDTQFCKSDFDCLLNPLGQKCCTSGSYSYCWKDCGTASGCGNDAECAAKDASKPKCCDVLGSKNCAASCGGGYTCSTDEDCATSQLGPKCCDKYGFKICSQSC